MESDGGEAGRGEMITVTVILVRGRRRGEAWLAAGERRGDVSCDI